MITALDIKLSYEKEFDNLYESIELEASNCIKIMESVAILESNNILIEAEATEKTLLDKVKVILNKAMMFFKKIKQIAMEKIINLGFKKTKELTEKCKKEFANVTDDLDEYIGKANLEYCFISDESIDKMNKFIRDDAKGCDELNDAYDSNDPDKIKEAIAKSHTYNTVNNMNMAASGWIKTVTEKIKDTGKNSIARYCLVINDRIEDAKKAISDNINQIDSIQTLLTRKLKLNNSHEQIECSLQMVRRFNDILQLFNKYVMANAKCAYINYKNLLSIYTQYKNALSEVKR